MACWLLALPASADPTRVVVEIDAAAERVVDARSARRLVPLELSDVVVPRGRARVAPALFFRVLGHPDGSLRLELWERGEYHGQRVLSRAGESPQLVARRVALAAAELARRLARKREVAHARDERQRRARLERARSARERTQDGPLALRSELAVAAGVTSFALLGSRLSAEVALLGRFRLDLGAELWAGKLQREHGMLLEGLSLAPSYRLALSRSLDLDGGLRAAALLLQVPSATSIDAVMEQDSSWTARLDAGLRLQLRLTRQLRGTLGTEMGALLRSVSLTTAAERQRLGGVWWGVSLGLVITPPR